MLPKARSHEDLIVWQRSIQLVVETYRIASLFPADERFGVASQLKRAVVSIPVNLAEGCGRVTRKELLHFIAIARGSLRELETLLFIAQELQFVTSLELTRSRALALEVGKMLNGLRKSLGAQPGNQTRHH